MAQEKHNLIIDSLRDPQARCECGRWNYMGTAAPDDTDGILRSRIVNQFALHYTIRVGDVVLSVETQEPFLVIAEAGNDCGVRMLEVLGVNNYVMLIGGDSLENAVDEDDRQWFGACDLEYVGTATSIPAGRLAAWTERSHSAKKRAEILKAWGEAERRIGKFVNIDEDTIQSLMMCPSYLLVNSVRAKLSSR